MIQNSMLGCLLQSDHLRMLPGEGSPFGEELASYIKAKLLAKTTTWERKKKQVSENDTEAIS